MAEVYLGTTESKKDVIRFESKDEQDKIVASYAMKFPNQGDHYGEFISFDESSNYDFTAYTLVLSCCNQLEISDPLGGGTTMKQDGRFDVYVKEDSVVLISHTIIEEE